ncbi:hypothetical protein TWF106_008883 [Orbilia oligospora]|uniref:DUF1754-domain-containing protein n=1 Tax=Orbilia oligospora TaxID=2813651 RepID=A0A6G1LVF8_ORBOL|nr:hypothetical protein TWF788_001045 [Orbilia oligospora]KAF3203086.1 hypothetical protein TWF679_010549 [Orbilia oligospora]KAF3207037.1 hypothetical protein TWF191_001144 [Orbilia oligospora]KAF3215042.1 hypothetical protein TWF106_008883 [Orbilia oligospora]KAF3235813.1 hypothetical protein TWF192_000629 [Orbilia oligospora]
MAKDDYATAGGPLRLKGSSGVVKHKSRKKTKPSKQSKSKDISQQNTKNLTENDDQGPSTSTIQQEMPQQRKHKTEAERKFEEARKKKLDQLLLKDAAKSHKERVEEFNKYLSNLSEHHDMPRIGPG